jgi:hypothetical protein|tara:strand:- start:825 stop:977 length:153 start_codon:yes stop_codon:yes gene_type:complete
MTNQEKLNLATDILLEVVENWDNDKIKNYPQTLPSFDELVIEIKNIELNN